MTLTHDLPHSTVCIFVFIINIQKCMWNTSHLIKQKSIPKWWVAIVINESSKLWVAMIVLLLLLVDLIVKLLIHMACFFFLQIEHKSLTLGEVLDGDRMAMSEYDIKFKRKWMFTYRNNIYSETSLNQTS